MAGLEEFCCICVKKYPHLENINEIDENKIRHLQKLSVCAPEQKWYQEYNICKNCLEMLDSTYNFIQICIGSEELRREQLKILTERNKEKKTNFTLELFECDLCKKQFKLKRSLKLHVTRIHRKHKFDKSDLENVEPPIIFQKDIKSEEVKEESDEKLGNHCMFLTKLENNEESDLNIYSDDQDDNRFIENDRCSDEESIKTQIEIKKKRYNRRKNPLTCEYCGKLFYRRQHYSAHIRSKHTFEKPYKCNLCDAKFTNSHSLLVHKRNHNNEKPFICSYCGKSFVCSGDLYHHSKIHLNKREYKCSQCEKSFNTASILRTHKICMHTDPKDWKYICSYCAKKFPINSSLANHLKRHTGNKGFSCHICEKKFFDKSELTKHLRCHSSDRKYKCSICQDKQYKNSYGLKKHMKVIHNIGTLNICKPEKKFLCPACPKIFAFNNKLQKHMCTHTGEKPFKCHVCDKKFIDNYYCKVHLKKKHNIAISEDN